ncbi:glycosyltransferase [Saccharicrinis sp. 156]|uniref:glycosyltransferase n=1 Tax=Saccharicrinis sp. 156 TaxID=3417574 RepID=UPI003D34F8C9
MYKHFVLTRFNIKLDGFATMDKNNNPVLTDEWLEERFYLFEKYCLPSLINQSCKEFIWFVLFDIDTPERFLERIKKYEMEFPQFKPFFMENGDYATIKKEFNRQMIKYFDEDTEYVITSRIDNDDSFHKDYIGDVQKQFVKQKDIFISFIYGLQYDIKTNVLARKLSKNNHYISRVERLNTAGIQTVLTYNHYHIDETGEVVYLDNRNKPMWLEIIHEGNIKNVLNNTSLPLFFGKGINTFKVELNISISNTAYAMLGYIKLRFLLARMKVLQTLGVYDLLKRKDQRY